ncbi:hypothetical protein F5884DRAFT_242765 [Xylogone sp. PMI_703]|nr:hypothetical protein F5884DRAFT_242765 [Xylogone sp. PMI_703]
MEKMDSTSDSSQQHSRIRSLFKSKFKRSFTYLEDTVQSSPLLDGEGNYDYLQPGRSPWPTRLTLINASICAVSLFCFVSSLILSIKSPSGSDTLRQTTFYSTVLEDLKPTWAPNAFKSHPLSSSKSIFRQDPSEEVDAAWNRVTDMNAFIISSEDVRRLGKDPSLALKAPESWGYGSDAYLAEVDGIHLVHCLDVLRKSLYHNYEHYFPNGSSISYHFHVAHCQEILAHHLMCQPSVELITYNWVEHMLPPYPDYDMTKQCWDYEQLLEWKDKKRVMRMNDDRWKSLRRPEGAKAVPLPVTIIEEYHISEPGSKKGD